MNISIKFTQVCMELCLVCVLQVVYVSLPYIDSSSKAGLLRLFFSLPPTSNLACLALGYSWICFIKIRPLSKF